MSEVTESRTLYCSFCRKSQYEVRKLIAGPTAFICDECIDLCTDILREQHVTDMAKRIAQPVIRIMRFFRKASRKGGHG